MPKFSPDLNSLEQKMSHNAQMYTLLLIITNGKEFIQNSMRAAYMSCVNEMCRPIVLYCVLKNFSGVKMPLHLQ